MAGEVLGAITGGAGAAAAGSSVLGGALAGAAGANPILSGINAATGGELGLPTSSPNTIGGLGGAVPTIGQIISGSANPSGSPVATVPTVSATPTPGGPSASSVSPQSMYAALTAQGFSPVQSVALMGNMKQESNFNPGAVNPGEGAQGVLQWRQGRLAGLQKYAAENGLSPTDYHTQAAWIRHEMNTTESKAGQAFLNATNLTDANNALKGYIRYGSPPDKGGVNTRLANAEVYAKQFGVNPNPVSAGGQGITTVGTTSAPTVAPSARGAMTAPTITPGAAPFAPGSAGAVGMTGSGSAASTGTTPTATETTAQRLAALLKQAHASAGATPPAPQVGQVGVGSGQQVAADTSRKQALLAPAAQILAQLRAETQNKAITPALGARSPVTI